MLGSGRCRRLRRRAPAPAARPGPPRRRRRPAARRAGRAPRPGRPPTTCSGTSSAPAGRRPTARPSSSSPTGWPRWRRPTRSSSSRPAGSPPAGTHAWLLRAPRALPRRAAGRVRPRRCDTVTPSVSPGGDTGGRSWDDAERDRARGRLRRSPPRPAVDRRLLDAVVAVADGLELDPTLRRIVRAASDLTNAPFAALGVLGEDGLHRAFVYTGIDPALAARDRPPAARARRPRAHHPGRAARSGSPTSASTRRPSGFPPGHPPMKSFLGVPVGIGERVVGNLYLADKTGRLHRGGRGRRRRAGRRGRRRRRQRRACTRTPAAARPGSPRRRRSRPSCSSGAEEDEALPLIARRAREVAGADVCGLVLPGWEGQWVLEVADGEQRRRARRHRHARGRPRGLRRPLRAAACRVADLSPSSRPLAGARDAALGPGALRPARRGDERAGVLVLLRRIGARRVHRRRPHDARRPSPARRRSRSSSPTAGAAPRRPRSSRSAPGSRATCTTSSSRSCSRWACGCTRLRGTARRRQPRRRRPVAGVPRPRRPADPLDDPRAARPRRGDRLRRPAPRRGEPRAQRPGLPARLTVARRRPRRRPGAPRRRGRRHRRRPRGPVERRPARPREPGRGAVAVDAGVLVVEVGDDGRGVDPAPSRRSGLDNLARARPPARRRPARRARTAPRAPSCAGRRRSAAEPRGRGPVQRPAQPSEVFQPVPGGARPPTRRPGSGGGSPSWRAAR